MCSSPSAPPTATPRCSPTPTGSTSGGARRASTSRSATARTTASARHSRGWRPAWCWRSSPPRCRACGSCPTRCTRSPRSSASAARPRCRSSGIASGRATPVGTALVGRRAELTALRSAVDRAARGTGAAVVVLGEAGIGKSRLVAEAVDRARAAGMAVLTGRAVAGGGAYRAVAAALAGHLRDRSPSGIDVDEELRPFLPALGKLLPGWTPGDDDPDRADEADPTVVLGEGVLRLLRP